MILIFSDQSDISTKVVSQWLKKFNARFIRIDHEQDSLSISQLKQGKLRLLVNLKDKMDTSELTSVWYRRGRIQVPLIGSFDSSKLEDNRGLYNASLNYSETYSLSITEIILKELTRLPWLGKYEVNRINKIHVLNIAESVGLKIPETRIISEKTDLVRFKKKSGAIINKSLDSTFFAYLDESRTRVTSYTEIVTDEMIESIDNGFPPSLFQKNIKKQFEIRVFYIDGNFFATAIFSQAAAETIVDFRNYQSDSITRCVPFDLPSKVKIKIDRLMKQLDLNTGSIDLIYSINDEYIFLEVNPTGQFGYHGFVCNYNLEKHIASHLIKQKKL